MATKRNWAADEIGFIEEVYGRMTRAQLARHFRTTVDEIDDIIDRRQIVPKHEREVPVKLRPLKLDQCERVYIPELRAHVWVKKGRDKAAVVRRILDREVDFGDIE